MISVLGEELSRSFPMRVWVVVVPILTMAGSAAFVAYRLRHMEGSSRQAIAGAVVAFNLGAWGVVGELLAPSVVTTITEAAFIAVAIAFLIAEIRLDRLDRKSAGSR
jgi:hypothetical protein